MNDKQQLTQRARAGLRLKNTAKLMAAAVGALLVSQASIAQATPRPLKVVIISMFPPEAASWIAPLHPAGSMSSASPYRAPHQTSTALTLGERRTHR
jgi:purine nucleoside permease